MVDCLWLVADVRLGMANTGNSGRKESKKMTILRVDDSLYEQRLVPIKEGEIILPILQESWRKYGRGSEPTSTARVDDELIWLFEIVDRA